MAKLLAFQKFELPLQHILRQRMIFAKCLRAIIMLVAEPYRLSLSHANARNLCETLFFGENREATAFIIYLTQISFAMPKNNEIRVSMKNSSANCALNGAKSVVPTFLNAKVGRVALW